MLWWGKKAKDLTQRKSTEGPEKWKTVPSGCGWVGWVPRSLRSGQQNALASGRDDRIGEEKAKRGTIYRAPTCFRTKIGRDMR